MNIPEHFKCDEQLQVVLEKHGFTECNSESDKIKGKKEFKSSLKSRLHVYFDYINFRFYERGADPSGMGGTKVSADDLHLLLWYVKSNAADKKYISEGSFKIEAARKTLNTFKQEHEFYRQNNFKNKSIPKLERLIGSYEAIILD